MNIEMGMLRLTDARLSKREKYLPHRQQINRNKIVLVRIINRRPLFIDDDVLGKINSAFRSLSESTITVTEALKAMDLSG